MKIEINVSVFTNKDLKQLKEINNRLDGFALDFEVLKKLLTPNKYVPADLERAIIAVGRRAVNIDKKVPDLP